MHAAAPAAMMAPPIRMAGMVLLMGLTTGIFAQVQTRGEVMTTGRTSTCSAFSGYSLQSTLISEATFEKPDYKYREQGET